MSVASPKATGSYSDYLSAVRDGDRQRAFEVVDEAREHGASLSAIYLDIFQPALQEIGRLWEENELSVADEHLATAITQAAMARSYQQVFAPARGEPRSLLAACADLERHDVGLRMLCDLLDLEGWETKYLGAAVPISDLLRMIERSDPDVVAISVSLPIHVPRAEEIVSRIQEKFADPPLILLGGRPFVENPGLAKSLGADLTAPDARQAVESLRTEFSPP